MPERDWTAEEVGERFFFPTHLVEYWVKTGQHPGIETAPGGVLIPESSLKGFFEWQRGWIEEGFTQEDANELKEIVDRMSDTYALTGKLEDEGYPQGED